MSLSQAEAGIELDKQSPSPLKLQSKTAVYEMERRSLKDQILSSRSNLKTTENNIKKHIKDWKDHQK